jgi:hypothetical protein
MLQEFEMALRRVRPRVYTVQFKRFELLSTREDTLDRLADFGAEETEMLEARKGDDGERGRLYTLVGAT